MALFIVPLFCSGFFLIIFITFLYIFYTTLKKRPWRQADTFCSAFGYRLRSFRIPPSPVSYTASPSFGYRQCVSVFLRGSVFLPCLFEDRPEVSFCCIFRLVCRNLSYFPEISQNFRIFSKISLFFFHFRVFSLVFASFLCIITSISVHGCRPKGVKYETYQRGKQSVTMQLRQRKLRN